MSLPTNVTEKLWTLAGTFVLEGGNPDAIVAMQEALFPAQRNVLDTVVSAGTMRRHSVADDITVDELIELGLLVAFWDRDAGEHVGPTKLGSALASV